MSLKSIRFSVSNVRESIAWRVEVFFESLGILFFLKDGVKKASHQWKNPNKEQFVFIEDFEEWMRDGANMVVACKRIAEAARAKGVKNTFQERAGESIAAGLTSGKSVADSMQGLFNKEIIDIFSIGERTNTLDVLVAEYRKNTEEVSAIINKVVKKFIYPSMVFSLLVSVLFVVGTIGVEKIQELVPLSRLPGDARQLVEWGQHVAAYSNVYSAMVFALFVAFTTSKSRLVGPVRDWMDKYLPPFKVYKALVANTVMKRIAMLSRSGISLNETITLLQKNSTPYEKSFYNQVKVNLTSKHGSVAEYLDVGLLDPSIFARLNALSSLEGEKAKFNAIFVSGERSGKVAEKSISDMSRMTIWLFWVATGILGFVVVLGILDFTFNIDKMIQ